mmetsp:Transcript_14865/g.32700  ORF Transcript_14865/g.32700 Transcript_14865/m.32700 type:complete len:233 (+) Transcript_14865:1444-2142(+)
MFHLANLEGSEGSLAMANSGPARFTWSTATRTADPGHRPSAGRSPPPSCPVRSLRRSLSMSRSAIMPSSAAPSLSSSLRTEPRCVPISRCIPARSSGDIPSYTCCSIRSCVKDTDESDETSTMPPSTSGGRFVSNPPSGDSVPFDSRRRRSPRSARPRRHDSTLSALRGSVPSRLVRFETMTLATESNVLTLASLSSSQAYRCLAGLYDTMPDPTSRLSSWTTNMACPRVRL